MVAGGNRSTGQTVETSYKVEISKEGAVADNTGQAEAVAKGDTEQQLVKVQRKNGPGSLNMGNRKSDKIERPATRDTALSPALLLTSQPETTDGIVRVPLEDQGLRISIDDGRGSRRMISIPTFSFGSQKLTGQSFVPVSAPKGVW